MSGEAERLLSSEDETEVTFRKPQSRCTPRLGLAVLLCTLGSSFPYGYSVGVVNAPQKVIEGFINTTHVERTGEPMSETTISLVWSATVSIWAVGGMIGGLGAGLVANRFGRRGGLLVTSMLMVGGGLFMLCSKFARSYEMLIAGRFLAGIQNGVGVVLCPMYLSEIAPLRLRGLIGTLNQVVVVLAVSISQVLGLDAVLGNADNWHYLLGIAGVPSLLVLILFPFCPESPRYLYLNLHRKAKALEALQWFQPGPVAAEEMRLIEEEKAATEDQRKFGVCDLFRDPSLRAPLVLSVVMHLSQQLSGVNAAMFYSTSIFMDAGLSVFTAQYVTLGLGAVLFITSCLSAVLVDRAGRRVLHLGGLSGMFLSAILITIAFVTKVQANFMTYVSVVGVFTFIIMFATGPGSIPWFLVAELFRQGPRGAAMSIGVLANWFANFLVGITFPTIQRTLGAYSFMPFVVLLAIFIIFLYFRLPETKNKSIEEITAQFERRGATHHLSN